MKEFVAVETGLNTYSVRRDGFTIHAEMSKEKAEKVAQEYNNGNLLRVFDGFGREITITKEEYQKWLELQEYRSHWYHDPVTMMLLFVVVVVGSMMCVAILTALGIIT